MQSQGRGGLVDQRADVEERLTRADRIGKAALLLAAVAMDHAHRQADHAAQGVQHHQAAAAGDECLARAQANLETQPARLYMQAHLPVEGVTALSVQHHAAHPATPVLGRSLGFTLALDQRMAAPPGIAHHQAGAAHDFQAVQMQPLQLGAGHFETHRATGQRLAGGCLPITAEQAPGKTCGCVHVRGPYCDGRDAR
jgi:hypothetical protein